MTREIDEVFIEEAIERYRRIDERLASFASASAGMEVTVHSPDGLVTVVVAVDGTIRDLDIDDRLLSSDGADVSRSVRLVVTAAADAATWARAKLRSETFADYDPIGEGLMELDHAARRVDEVGVDLAGCAARLRAAQPAPAAFGAEATGALGDLGQVLAAAASGAIRARALEATALGSAASALAAAVSRASGAYRETDDRRGTSRPGGA